MRRASENQHVAFQDLNLLKNTGDLFMAGTETTSTAITWIILFFLHYPQVQERCYQEVCDVIGTQRPPSMLDKAKMTYLEATIMEVLRYANIAPLSAPHSTSCDVSFRGYVIPKGTYVVANMSSVLHDPASWGDPENFRPERFIGTDGKLSVPGAYIPFSLGERVSYIPFSLGERVSYIPFSLGERVSYTPFSLGEKVIYIPFSLGERVSSTPFSLGEKVSYTPFSLGERVSYIPFSLGERVSSIPFSLGERVSSIPSAWVRGSATFRSA